MSRESNDTGKEKYPVLSGTVVSGTKRAAFFTQLEWVKSQCLSKLGFEPYPGTLNIALTETDSALMAKIRESNGVTLAPPDTENCAGTVYHVQIGKTPGAIILPEESVRKNSADIVEILAPVCLRDALKVTDGDVVSLQVIRIKPPRRGG